MLRKPRQLPPLQKKRPLKLPPLRARREEILAQSWAEYLRATASLTDLGPVWQVLAGSILFAVVSITLPRSFAAGITGRASLGLVNAVRATR